MDTINHVAGRSPAVKMQGRTCTASKTQKLGFTLIEMLVVITIIALLMAMLVPAVKKAKEVARSAMCQSNERQLYLAIASYAGDFREIVPPAYTYGCSSFAADSQWQIWSGLIKPFVPGVDSDPGFAGFYDNFQGGQLGPPPPTIRTVMHCPSELPHGGGVYRQGNKTWVYGNIREDYAPNVLRSGRAGTSGGSLCGPYGQGGVTNFYSLEVRSYIGREQVYKGAPSDVFLLADGTYIDIEPAYAYSYGPVPIGFGYRHFQRKTLNLLFFDGHSAVQDDPVPDNGYQGNPQANSMPYDWPW